MPFEIKSAAPDIDPGTYRATLTGVRPEHTEKFGGSDFYIWDWVLDVPGKAEPVEFSDSTGASTSPGTKTYIRLEALTGKAPVIGETVPDPVGMGCQLTIGKKPNGFPEVLAIIPAPKQTEAGLPA